MSDESWVALLIPQSKFTKKDSNDGPKLVDVVVSEITDILKRIGNEGKRAILISDMNKKVNKELLENLTSLSKSHSAEMKLLEDKNTLEEILIYAKPSIDEIGANDINLIIPKNEETNCRNLIPLIFNEKTYKAKYTTINVDNILDEEINTDSLVKIKKILSEMPSADGKEIKTMKSKMIPDDIFYHGFTTRYGGVSTYPTMKSLPLAMSLRKKDTRVYVEENRRRLAQTEGFTYEDFHCASAVHGIDVWVIGDKEPSTYDAIATNKPGVTIAAPGADCQTILFCDVKKKVVAAAHSGWKGTIDRIQQNVIKVMKERFECEVKDIHVSIGPSIGACCYNVDDSRAKDFVGRVGESVIENRDGTAYLDLWKATVMLLEEVGIERKNIDDGKRFNENELIGYDKVTQCTQCNKDKFFSYRRDGLLFGNQIGFIGIKDTMKL